MTLYMPFFRSCSTLRTLTQLHAHLLVTGLHHAPQASTKLIESYAQMGNINSAQNVFSTYHNPDSFMWGMLIKCFVWNNFYEEAISFYRRMFHQRIQLNRFMIPSILRACSGCNDLGTGKVIHGSVIKSGFEGDYVIEAALLCMYGDLGSIDHARKVFDEMFIRDDVSWSSMISSYVRNREYSDGLELFRQMVSEGMEIDSVTMLSVAESCGELFSIGLGKSVHGFAVRREIGSHDLDNSLILMYSKCDSLCSAERLFRNNGNKTVSSWTAMISCYNQNACCREALNVFSEMLGSEVEPNSMTMVGVIYACARLGFLKDGKSGHCYVIRRGIDPEFEVLGPALVDLYAVCGSHTDCTRIFDGSKEKNVIMWNMLISVHVQRAGLVEDALLIFKRMHMLGFSPDSFTLSSVLSGCGGAGFYQLGTQVHSFVTKTGNTDEFVQNSLIDMYCKCGSVESACLIFDIMHDKSVVTWNSMLCGLTQNGRSEEAICLFDDMYLNSLEMNEVTFLSVVQACSNLGYLQKGKWLHQKLIVCGLGKDLYIDSALTDMYAKCGEIKMAQGVFDSMKEKNVVSWSAMIAGYGAHGDIDTAKSLFAQMVESGIKPNEITFLNILSACGHAGDVGDGELYFDSMIRDYAVEPRSEHYACMVDILSRAGDLDGAYRIITSMPFQADASIWGCLLNGCRIHQRVDMVRDVEDYLSKVSTIDTGYYTLLSNIHAESKNWNESGRVRSKIEGMGLKKVPGYSTLENSS